MSDFTPYTPEVPDNISQIRISVFSYYLEDRDEDGNPLGTFTESEGIEAEAILVDADGIIVRTHMTNSPSVLITNGIFTSEQLQTIQAWIQAVRDNAESVLLPSV